MNITLPLSISTDNPPPTEQLAETCLMRSPRGDVERLPICAVDAILNLIRRGWTFVQEVEG